MDIGSVIGTFGSFVLVFVAIKMEGGNPMAFINGPAFLMVGGGLLLTTLLAYPMDQTKELVKIMRQVFFNKGHNPVETINTLVEMCTMVRRDGLLALEAMVPQLHDPFLAKGVQFVVDGGEPEMTRKILEMDLANKKHRHATARGMLEFAGGVAPGFALVGTLVGLVSMLADLDPATVGHKMALALLCTTYGCFISNALCLPMAQKLKFFSAHEILINQMQMEGLLGIQAGENPRNLEDKLKAFLPVGQRESAGAGAKGGAAMGEAA